MFESFWPKAIEPRSRTAPDPHGAGRRSKAIHDIGVWINDATKIVFSRTRTDVTWKNSRLVHAIDPAAIEAMKHEDGRDIMVFGSGSVATELTRYGLIDEYQFIVNPVFIGTGRNLLSGTPLDTALEILEAKKYKSGNVMLRYARRT